MLRTHSGEPFDVMQFLMPTLAGALTGAWRAGKPSRRATLGLAIAAGAVSGWLFLGVLMLAQFYHFNSVGYLFSWGLTGAVFGALGYGAWLLSWWLVSVFSAGGLKKGESHA